MGLKSKVGLAFDVAACRFFGRRKPLVVAWSVTNKCNRRCAYCASPDLPGDELEAEEGLRLLEQVAAAGVRIVSFTGGEPLIHKPIEKYIEKVNQLGMGCGVNTNGVLVRKKADLLKTVRFIKLSLDGPPDLHDEIRGGPCADAVFDALEVCKENKITATLLAVLTSRNLDQIDYLVGVAEKYGITVAFQPATGHTLKSADDNPLSSTSEEYQACIDRIIALKKTGKGRFIGNSKAGLTHLRKWPEPVPMKCEGQRVSARIEPDGRLYHCGRMIQHMKGHDVLSLGFAEAFSRLQMEECDFCWCAHRVETNLILGLKPSAVFEALKARFF